ncbi:MAG TPA: pyridoxamine 5'-phosphate oxidase family protein [Candidatus Saccharimonadales bacterium]|nr:pyridoxamine 5'-phosphate oxidase family protein [Candidatus Saccharimonadales bacterium]
MVKAEASITELQKRLQTAAENLQKVMIGALGTVNADGNPHISPLFLAYDADLHFVWSSGTATLHSKNIEREGRVFITIFDSITAHGGGLYLQATARAAQPHEPAFMQAFQTFNARKAQFGAPTSPQSNYQSGAQTLYMATPQRFWVNMSQKDENGAVIGDERIEIALSDIQKYL